MRRSSSSIISSLIKERRYYEALNLAKKEKLPISNIMESINLAIQEANSNFEKENYQISINTFTDLLGVYDGELVVAKYFTPKTEIYLIDYLIALHKRGLSAPNFTRLLFNLLIKTNSIDKLHQFISYIKNAQEAKKHTSSNKKTKEDVSFQRFLKKFNVEVAIEALSSGGFVSEAVSISDAIGISEVTISSLLKDKRIKEAAHLISEHSDEPIGRSLLLRHGHSILNENGEEGKEIGAILSKAASIAWKRDSVEDCTEYLKVFWGKPEAANNFLGRSIEERPTMSICTHLAMLLMPREKPIFYGHHSVVSADGCLSVLRDRGLPIDEDQLLAVCAEVGFKRGVVAILKRKGRTHEALSYLLEVCSDIDALIDLCIDGEFASSDWDLILRSLCNSCSAFNSKAVGVLQRAVNGAMKTRSQSFVYKMVKESIIPEDVKESIFDMISKREEEMPINVELERLRQMADEIDKQRHQKNLTIRSSTDSDLGYNQALPYTSQEPQKEKLYEIL